MTTITRALNTITTTTKTITVTTLKIARKYQSTTIYTLFFRWFFLSMSKVNTHKNLVNYNAMCLEEVGRRRQHKRFEMFQFVGAYGIRYTAVQTTALCGQTKYKQILTKNKNSNSY